MGLIETIEQDRARVEAETQLRLKRQQEELERQNARKAAALRAYNESGMETLLSKFQEAVGARKNLRPGARYDFLQKSSFNPPPIEHPPSEAMLKNRLESTYDFAVWSGGSCYDGNYGKVTPKRYLVIEATPDSTIHFHGGTFGSSSVPAHTWRSHPDALEKALEKAYRNPKKYDECEWKMVGGF